MKLWPESVGLANYFADYRAVQMSRFTCRFFPGLAFLTIIFPLVFDFKYLLPQMVVYGLFIGSMPLQALVILGVKADKFLPPSLANWYKEGAVKFNQQGGEIRLSVHKPRYIDLATLLNLSYSQSIK